MCGRFSLKADLEDIQSRFELFQDDLAHSPSYNIAPTQPVLAVTSGDGRMASHLRWGLIPPWSKNAEVGNRLINARAETVAERPSFRTALARRRCSSWPTGSNCRGPAYFHPLRPIGVVPGPGVVSNMRTCLPAAGNGPTGLWRGHPGGGARPGILTQWRKTRFGAAGRGPLWGRGRPYRGLAGLRGLCGHPGASGAYYGA